MGASDSKLVFKKGIFKLSENKIIPADDEYWASVSVASSSRTCTVLTSRIVLGAARVYRRCFYSILLFGHPAD
jgi:hypothetical protein